MKQIFCTLIALFFASTSTGQATDTVAIFYTGNTSGQMRAKYQ